MLKDMIQESVKESRVQFSEEMDIKMAAASENYIGEMKKTLGPIEKSIDSLTETQREMLNREEVRDKRVDALEKQYEELRGDTPRWKKFQKKKFPPETESSVIICSYPCIQL